MQSLPMLLENAPAKINLSLHVTGRRADGYHLLDSLVAFADVGDVLTLDPAAPPGLTLTGPRAGAIAAEGDNLVLRATREFAARVPGLRSGRFHLEKHLPVAAGLGGGSADAGAALRLLARLNDLAADDPRLIAAAAATGSDVPVCLAAKARWMRGIGEVLSAPLALPPLAALLVNPGVPTPTAAVFKALGLAPGASAREIGEGAAALEAAREGEALLAALAATANDLEAAALVVTPAVGEALASLRDLPGCRLARMSGSGATVFGLFTDEAARNAGAENLRQTRPDWWIAAALIG